MEIENNIDRFEAKMENDKNEGSADAITEEEKLEILEQEYQWKAMMEADEVSEAVHKAFWENN